MIQAMSMRRSACFPLSSMLSRLEVQRTDRNQRGSRRIRNTEFQFDRCPPSLESVSHNATLSSTSLWMGIAPNSPKDGISQVTRASRQSANSTVMNPTFAESVSAAGSGESKTPLTRLGSSPGTVAAACRVAAFQVPDPTRLATDRGFKYQRTRPVRGFLAQN
jgi:hypothetical protein